ncbi:MAG: hypothetical protein ACYC40_02770 [Patescibacteria group bacterium]
MKKYFNKIIFVLIITFIFPMSSGFCFQGLLGSATKVNIAKAAENMTDSMADLAINGNEPMVFENNVCSDNIINSPLADNSFANVLNLDKIYNQPSLSEAMPAAHSKNHKALLPCCVDGNQPIIIASSQAAEIYKFIPISVSDNFEELTLNISRTISYQAPITAPPELLSLRTTILRL